MEDQKAIEPKFSHALKDLAEDFEFNEKPPPPGQDVGDGATTYNGGPALSVHTEVQSGLGEHFK